MKPVHNIFGIILAAGASSRIGSPKANLKYFDGETLLKKQVCCLKSGGVLDVIVVTGKDSSAIQDENKDLFVQWIENSKWQDGQFTSIQAAAAKAIKEGAVGMLIMPVDSAGVTKQVIGALIQTALTNPHLFAVVPEFESRNGHPVYVSRAFAEKLVSLDSVSCDSRLDTQLQKEKRKILLPVSDPNILANINTLDDWERLKNL